MNFISKKADTIITLFSAAIAAAMALLLLTIFAFIAQESLPAWQQQGILPLLTGSEWQPLAEPPQLGILIMFASTLWSALGAMLIAAPLGICCAIFLAEFAPVWLAALIRPVLNMLTGIPSVVYGFLGATVLVRFFETKLFLASGESLFCASLVLAIMVIPYIVAGGYSALRAIPAEYRTAVIAMGISKPYAAIHVLLPMAKKSMISAVTLAFGRAAGETMAVLMLAGNTLLIPSSWFAKGEPLSALIALELGSSVVGSPQYQGLFAAGLVLLTFVSAINLTIYFSSRGSRNEAKLK